MQSYTHMYIFIAIIIFCIINIYSMGNLFNTPTIQNKMDIEQFKNLLKNYIDLHTDLNAYIMNANTFRFYDFENNFDKLYSISSLDELQNLSNFKPDNQMGERCYDNIDSALETYKKLLKIIAEMKDNISNVASRNIDLMYYNIDIYKFNEMCIPESIFNDDFIEICKKYYNELSRM